MKVFHTYVETNERSDTGIIVAENLEKAQKIFNEAEKDTEGFKDICEVDLDTEYYIITNRTYHHKLFQRRDFNE